MIIFFLFYTAYALANFYVFLKIKYTFYPATAGTVFLGLFLLLMTLSPTLIHLYNLRSSGTLARVFAYIGYMWVALITFFFSTGILFDLYNLIIKIGTFVLQKDLDRIVLSSTSTFFIPLFLSIAFNAYGYFEAKKLRVERLTVETSKLPVGINSHREGANKLTIAQISDLHLGIIVREATLDRVIKEIENAKPDLIVSTGDLLDAEVNHVDYLADRLKRIQAKLGKFAVTGNHEFFGGIVHSLKFLQEAGFRVLRGEAVTIQNLINIAGVDDPIIKSFKYSRTNLNERDILSPLPSNIFTLLLKHRPNTNKDTHGLFDLQLSGHTHKGQIFPINFVTTFLFHYHAGYTKLPKGSALYVSRGTGTAGPPVRFFSPPELTIIEVISEKESQMNTDIKK
jgi:predicted MPP superfamily phosphohydrolase